jgi:thymidylate synthase
MIGRLPVFTDAYSAYLATLQHLLRHGQKAAPVGDPTSVGSHFGQALRPTVETLAVGFTLSNPRARLLYSPNRRLSLGFGVGYFLWLLSAKNSLSHISFYSGSGDKFSRDKRTLSGAIGTRMITAEFGLQLDSVIRYIRDDPVTRRAVIQLFMPSDLTDRPLDTPCTTSLQFLLRDGRLTLLVVMRSQSAAALLPYDIFTFSMLQEAVCVTLGVALGDYVHFCGSMHFYEDERSLVDAVLTEAGGFACNMPPMDTSPIGNHVLLNAEQAIRQSLENGTLINWSGLGLDGYWRDLMSATVVSIANRNGLILQQDITSPDMYKAWM